MGIISPTNKVNNKPYSGSKKALADAMSYAANQNVESPVSGERTTQWQAVVDRLYKTAIYAESDKDATSAAKVIRDTLFGRPAVQKQEKIADIPRTVFVIKNNELKQIEEKAARATPDEEDLEEQSEFSVRIEDGEEVVV